MSQDVRQSRFGKLFEQAKALRSTNVPPHSTSDGSVRLRRIGSKGSRAGTIGSSMRHASRDVLSPGPRPQRITTHISTQPKPQPLSPLRREFLDEKLYPEEKKYPGEKSGAARSQRHVPFGYSREFEESSGKKQMEVKEVEDGEDVKLGLELGSIGKGDGLGSLGGRLSTKLLGDSRGITGSLGEKGDKKTKKEEGKENLTGEDHNDENKDSAGCCGCYGHDGSKEEDVTRVREKSCCFAYMGCNCCMCEGCISPERLDDMPLIESIGYYDWCYNTNLAISYFCCCLCLNCDRETRIAEEIENGARWRHGYHKEWKNRLDKFKQKFPKDAILSIYVNGAQLEPDLRVRHPMVRIHIVSHETGNYMLKSNRGRKIVSPYESPAERLPPLLTQPCNLPHSGSFLAEWKQQIKINEAAWHLCKPTSLLLFEIIDIDRTTAIEHNIAWGFLKIVSSTGRPYMFTQTNIQLNRYTSKAHRTGSQDHPDTPAVYYEWMHQRTHGYCHYPSCLRVRVTAVAPPPRKVTVGKRPDFVTEVEQGRLTYRELISQTNKEEAKMAHDGVQIDTKAAEDSRKRKRLGFERCQMPVSICNRIDCVSGAMAIAFSPDGSHIAVASSNTVVVQGEVRTIFVLHIHHTATGHHIHTFIGHHGAIMELRWSQDGQYILTASKDQTAKLFSMKLSLQDGVHVREVQHIKSYQHTAGVQTACFHPTASNPSIIITGADDRTVRVWDAERGDMVAVLHSHSAAVTTIDFAHHGRIFYTADSNGAVKTWKDKYLSEAFFFDPNNCNSWATRFQVINTVDVGETAVLCLRYHSRPERLIVLTR
ncbi:hypothetical protein AAMO2058_000367000 [Amorphochlora amoebiformis]